MENIEEYQRSSDDVKESINEAWHEQFFYDKQSDSFIPYVCLICDEFIKVSQLKWLTKTKLLQNIHLLEEKEYAKVNNDDLRKCYFYGESKNGYIPEFDKCLVSPRACFLNKGQGKYSLCCSCYHYFGRKQEMPFSAICNNNFRGCTPDVLQQLTHVERSYLCQVKTHGFLFHFKGGQQLKLHGTLGFFQVSNESTVRGISFLRSLGVDVCVLIYGKMTHHQLQKARSYSKINTQRLTNAINWLRVNNVHWKDIPDNWLDCFEFRQPTVIEEVEELENSEDVGLRDIEMQEKFTIYYPDAGAQKATGGQDTPEEFRTMVAQSQSHGFDLNFQADMDKKFIQNQLLDDNFVRMNLIQFPYGRGGINESRVSVTCPQVAQKNAMKLTPFLEMMRRQSLPQFHSQLFCLVLYNLRMRKMMIDNALMVVGNGFEAEEIAENLEANDLERAAQAMGHRTQGGSSASRLFLSKIKALAGALPHTNEAAGKACMHMEAMFHNLGPPQVFFTMTPDDNNSMALQITAYRIIDDEKQVLSLPKNIIDERTRQRHELRLQVPGLCAYVFENALDVVLKNVVGWDRDNGCRTVQKGLFGTCNACTVSVEEQGRLSLHAHILVWVEELRGVFDDLRSPVELIVENAQNRVAAMYESVSTTSMFNPCKSEQKKRKLEQAFEHVCTDGKLSRKLPKVVGDQQLRNLRHKFGHKETHGLFLYCPDCGGNNMTNEEAVGKLLSKGYNIPGVEAYPNTNILHSMVVRGQIMKTNEKIDDIVKLAAYNNHHSCHTRTCFKCNKKDEYQQCHQSDYECRMRYPQLPVKKTRMEKQIQGSYYLWNGECHDMFFYAMRKQRHPYDCFQNVALAALTLSRMSGNSNVMLLTFGAVIMYVCKYTFKSNSQEEQRDFKRVVKQSRVMLQNGRKHQPNRAEALRRVLYATYQHNTANVVGSPMAAYLVSEGSRFYLSHEVAWCPVDKMLQFSAGAELNSRLKSHGNLQIPQKRWLDYLCRPKEFEDMSLFEFTRECYSAFPKKGIQITMYENTELYKHPSFVKGKMRQGVARLKKPALVQIPQRLFPDTGNFKGNILDPNFIPNTEAQQYAKVVLFLFMPYRNFEELLIHGRPDYVEKLRSMINCGKLYKNFEFFLQNIQDSKYNLLRYAIKDSLEECTEPYKCSNEVIASHNSEVLEDEDEYSTLQLLNAVFEELEQGHVDKWDLEHKRLSFEKIIKRGRVYVEDCHVSKPIIIDRTRNTSLYSVDQFVVYEDGNTAQSTESDISDSDADNELPQQTTDVQSSSEFPTRKHMFKLLMTRRCQVYRFQSSESGTTIQIANGSAESVVDWAKQSRLDDKQRKAFITLVSEFIMTFQNDSCTNDDMSRTEMLNYKHEMKKLKLLARLGEREPHGEQMIMFMHGPGGSGKSYVISLLIQYAKEYCSHLNFPFNSNTILITAMSGVAATLLGGITAHSGLALCRSIKEDDMKSFESTRLVIVDEISFAGQADVAAMDEKLRVLKNKQHKPFGGVHIVFAGDMRQLEPVGKKPLYQDRCDQFEFFNVYVELSGHHRFKKDPKWGELLHRFRDGKMTEEDIQLINKRKVCYGDELPDGIQFATFRNKSRDIINTLHFKKYCRDNSDSNGIVPNAILILADGILRQTADKTFTAMNAKHIFYDEIAEDDCEPKKQKPRVDPVLKLYKDCPMMLTHNICVDAGRANGTCVTLERVVLKPNEQPILIQVDEDVKVYAYYASQVRNIEVRHECKKFDPSIFSIKSDTHSMKVKWNVIRDFDDLIGNSNAIEEVPMKFHQFPIVRNTGTTGHKLQGKSVENIMIFEWSYTSNWAYVVLSRVKEMKGLYLREAMNPNLSKYAVPEAYTKWMAEIAKNETSYPRVEEYEEISTLPRNHRL